MKYICFLLCILFFTNCTSRAVEPTRASRHIIDSLFEQSLIVMQPQVDSLCVELSAITYKEAVDSLMEMRKSEMNTLVQ